MARESQTDDASEEQPTSIEQIVADHDGVTVGHTAHDDGEFAFADIRVEGDGDVPAVLLIDLSDAGLAVTHASDHALSGAVGLVVEPGDD